MNCTAATPAKAPIAVPSTRATRDSQRSMLSPYRLHRLDANRTIGRVPDALVIIVNPTAGSGRAAKLVPWIRERLALRPDAELHVTIRRGEAQGLAARAGAGGCDRLVA